MEPENNSFTSGQLIGVTIVCVLVLGGLGYYSWIRAFPPEPTQEELQSLQTAEQRIMAGIETSAEASTLKDEIPSVTPVTSNPVEEMYHNPFE
jgi:hypothetical protein